MPALRLWPLGEMVRFYPKEQELQAGIGCQKPIVGHTLE